MIAQLDSRSLQCSPSPVRSPPRAAIGQEKENVGIAVYSLANLAFMPDKPAGEVREP